MSTFNNLFYIMSKKNNFWSKFSRFTKEINAKVEINSKNNNKKKEQGNLAVFLRSLRESFVVLKSGIIG